MSQRIKGQEVTVTMVSPAGTEESLADLQSAEIEFQRDILSEGFLGETTERKDDIFRGVRGQIQGHMQTQDFFRFAQRVNDRSQRRTPASETFNVLVTLAFPNGERPRVQLQDVYFGSIPVNVNARDEYVSFTVSFECSRGRILFS